MRVCLCSHTVFEVPLSTSLTVCETKDIVASHLSIEPQYVILIYKGVILQDHSTLSFYGNVQEP